ncbi:MAG: type II secretion system protein [Candidatus Omnitrophota bacterium]
MKKKAFTLIEVMVTVIIVGVLASLAFPNLLKAMEIQTVNAAKLYLQQIAAAIQITVDHSKSYDFCGKDSTPVCLNTADVNEALDLDIQSDDFYFTVQSAGSGEIWYIKALRQNGPVFYTINYDIDGDLEFVCQDSGDGACVWINME